MEFIESCLATALRQDTGWPVNWHWEAAGGRFCSFQSAGGRSALALLSRVLKVLYLGDASIHTVRVSKTAGFPVSDPEQPQGFQDW